MRPFLRINPFIHLQPENLIPAYIDGEGASGQMLIGYMRVSTNEQSLHLQRDALERMGCEGMYDDICSGRTIERPGLSKALDATRRRSRRLEAGQDRPFAAARGRVSRRSAEAWDRNYGLDRRCRYDDGDRQARIWHLRNAGRIRARPHSRAHDGGTGRSQGSWPCWRASPCHDQSEAQNRYDDQWRNTAKLGKSKFRPLRQP
jgi:hypothetical protein